MLFGARAVGCGSSSLQLHVCKPDLVLQERMPVVSSNAGAALWGRQASTRPDGAMRTVMEEDNDRLISDLEQKVAALKGATTGIHDEVTSQNRLLGGMADDFSKADSLMAGTLKRLDGLVTSAGGSSHMCLIIIFMVTLLVLMWWMYGRK
jgi:hypothetical protein